MASETDGLLGPRRNAALGCLLGPGFGDRDCRRRRITPFRTQSVIEWMNEVTYNWARTTPLLHTQSTIRAVDYVGGCH